RIRTMKSLETELGERFAANAMFLGSDIPERYFSDWMTTAPAGTARALVRPSSTEEVSALLKICHAHGVPVVPQGGRTGLAGGAQPVQGCVLISLEKMDRIEAVDAASSTISVES